MSIVTHRETEFSVGLNRTIILVRFLVSIATDIAESSQSWKVTVFDLLAWLQWYFIQTSRFSKELVELHSGDFYPLAYNIEEYKDQVISGHHSFG